jgi:hypothetical protein
MGKKLERVYQALLTGASDGLKDDKPFEYVRHQCPFASSKRIVKASLPALTDPDVKDRNVLNAVYALAIKYRLQDLGVEDDTPDEDDEKPGVPTITTETRNRLKRTTSDITLQ